MTDLTIELAPSTSPRTAEERAALLQDPGFGQVFSDHMVSARYSVQDGWHGARLTAVPAADPRPGDLRPALRPGDLRGPQGLPPARTGRWRCSGPSRTPRGSSARRAGWRWPRCPSSCSWTPCGCSCRQTATGCRPVTASRCTCVRWSSPLDPFLGVRPAREYQFLLFASPAGAYFPGGVRPVTVWLSTEYTRAAPGGTGEAKCAGNYAASLVAQAQAAEQGCDQVVWLDAVEHSYVEEMGGMNLYFVYADGRLVTPALTGTLLPGVTRDSILTLGADVGLQVEEGRITHRRVGGGLRRRLDQRGVRLRHGRGGDAGRPGQARARVVPRRRRRAGRADHEDPRGAARHPAGHRVRPARLDAPGRLTPRRLHRRRHRRLTPGRLNRVA